MFKSQYPYNHSTYFTRDDHLYTSELPPMNSREDILQENFMRDRRNMINAATPKRHSFKKLLDVVKNWRRRSDDFSFMSFPKTPR